MTTIFDKQRLRPAQPRTVSERRLDDAKCLRNTGSNARANGAMYLGGFVIECLLKAKLLETYPWLKNARTAEGKSRREKHLWNLCYRSHDLDEILAHLPDVTEGLKTAERLGHSRLYTSLRKICGQWTIYARYSPQSVGIEDARQFLRTVQEVKKWLK